MSQTVAPEWAEYFAARRRYETLYDPSRRESVLRWNRWVMTACSILGGAALVCVVLALVMDIGIWVRLIVVLAIFAAITVGILVPLMLAYRRRIRRETAQETALYLGVSAEGVHLAKFPVIRWDEIFLIAVIDRTASKPAQLKRPLLGTGARLSARSGNGWVSVMFALKNADAVIERAMDADARRFVSTWTQPSGPRTGTMSLVPDALVNPEPLAAMLYALEQGCRWSGTEFLAGPAAMDAMNRIGQLVDPTWVAPPPKK